MDEELIKKIIEEYVYWQSMGYDLEATIDKILVNPEIQDLYNG